MSAITYPEGVRPGALVPITAFSIYRNHQAVLPARMAWMTPDAAEVLRALDAAVSSAGGALYLSDCFRSELDQAKARFDFLTGTGRMQERRALVAIYPELKDYEACNGGLGKKAHSPAPWKSWHEAGRAIDVDMDPKWLGIDQRLFAQIADSLMWRCGARSVGDPRRVDVAEEWHWYFPGPHAWLHDAPSCAKGADYAAREAVKRAILAIREPR